eukprot:gene6992-5038_t
MTVEEKKTPNPWALTYLVIFANLGSVLFGYEIGATIWVMYTFSHYGSADDDQSKYSYYKITYENSALLGFVAAGAALGAVICYSLLLRFADNMSKKDEILLASTLYFIAGLFVSVAGELEWNTMGPLILLIAGRLVYGGGIASTLHSIPQYITETLPASVRGSYGSSVELMVMLGMNIGFFTGYINQLVGGYGWVWSFRIAYILALVMALCSLFIPHNPVWLMFHDYPDEDVLRALRFITPDADEDDLNKLKESISQERREKLVIDEKLAVYRMENTKHWVFQSGLYDALTPSLQLIVHDQLYRRCLLLKVTFNMLKIFTGQTVFLYFSFSIFEDFNLENAQDYVFGYLATRLVSAYVMLWIGDLLGRRTFLIISAIIMAVSLFLAGFSYVFYLGSYSYVFIFLSGFGFQLGFGSMAYFVLNEITPFYIRSTANALSNLALFTSYFAVTFVFPSALAYLGFEVVFFFFAVCNTLALYFVYFYIPETRHVDLEQCYRLVDEMFDSAPSISCMSDRLCGAQSRVRRDDTTDANEVRALLPTETS